MAGSFYLYKRGTVYYAEILDSRRKRIVTRSTGARDELEAAAIVGGWLSGGLPYDGQEKKIDEIEYFRDLLAAIGSAQFTEKQATQIVDALKKRGFISSGVQVGNSSIPIFVDYLREFWDYDKSVYVRDQHNRGKKIGRRYCYENTGFIDRYIKDFFGALRLFEITDTALSDFLASLKDKGLSGSTVNGVRKAIIKPLQYAYGKHLITMDPTTPIDKFAEDTQKRGILTPKEADAVFKVEWKDYRARVGNLIARNTGMRSGEILALRPSDIGIDRIFVRHSYSAQDGLKGTKTNEERTVPISPKTYSEIIKLVNDKRNPFKKNPERFIFYSVLETKPMEPRFLSEGLTDALEKIGITEDERKKRNLVFHGWRHYAAKYLAGHADKKTAMEITGHGTEAIFAMYSDHETATDREETFKRMQEALEGIDEAPEDPLAPYVQEWAKMNE